MAEKTYKRVVNHPNVYMMAEDEDGKRKLTRMAVGTTVEVNEAQIKQYGDKLIDPTDRKKLVDGKLKDGDDPQSETVKQLADHIKKLEAELAAAKKGK